MGDFRKKYPTREKKFLQGNIYLAPSQMVGPLVPRTMRFGSRGPSEDVCLGYVTEVN